MAVAVVRSLLWTRLTRLILSLKILENRFWVTRLN